VRDHGLYQQASYQVRFDWGPAAAERLANCSDVVVIVDVLSFSTAVEIAVARGAAVVPVRWGDSRKVEDEINRGAVHAVGRRARDRDHPWSIAPSSLLRLPERTRLVMASPNGANIAAAVARRRATVLAGCLRNARAVARAAQMLGTTIAVIAAGERWRDGSLRPSLEDLMGAGVILGHLADRGVGAFSPEARVAVAAATATTSHPALLRDCVTGRELAASGYSKDVDLAAEMDASGTVPTLLNGGFVACPAGLRTPALE
jgi:2-phosphosulfolactate phosphatase